MWDSWAPPPATPALLLALGTAAVTDIRRRRVPWWLTGGTIALGLAVAALHGPGVLLAAGLGAAAGGLTLPLAALAWLGGGDCLLLIAVGVWEGWQVALATALWTALVGGVLGIVAWARGRRTIPYAPAIALGALLALARN